MKQYTVVYREFFTRGSHTNSLVRNVWINVNESSSVVKELEKLNISSTQIEIVFGGHCKTIDWSKV